MYSKLKQFFLYVTLAGALIVSAHAGGAVPALHAQDGGALSDSDRSSPSADGAGRLPLTIQRTELPVDVDGALDEEAWRAAPPFELPWETLPGDNTRAPVSTTCRVLYDDSRLLLGCRAADPDPGSIRAYVTDRDDTGGHDRIVFSLDPFNDSRRSFEFSVSALGVQADWLFDDARRQLDDSWDAIWSSSGRITEDGYVVEAAIPFRSLRFPATSAVQTWGFHVRREWPRSRFIETRSMQWDRDDACQLCQANLLTGVQGVAPGVNVELNPTLTARRVDEDLDTANPAHGGVDAEPGLDARWSVTTDMTLNATANPDFSQVEADAPQLAVNNQFALFFPEKRPFFLEGADFFQTPLQAVFTRTVADPLFGTKVTGKMGSNAVGLMITRDRITNLLFPGNQGSSSASLDQGVTGLVGRYRRDIGDSGTIGALYTGRVGEGYSNHVGGADVFLRPLSSLSLNVQYLRSETRYPDAVALNNDQATGRFGGDAGLLRATYRTRDWSFSLDGWLRDPGFRADAGFVPQSDARGLNVFTNRNFWPENGFFTRIGVGAGAWRSETTQGRLNDEGWWLSSSIDGPWQSNVWINPNVIRRFFDGRTFESFEWWSGASIRPVGSLNVSITTVLGDQIDFRNAQLGNQVRLHPSVGLRLGRHADLRLSGTWQRVSKDGERIFTALVSQARAVYSFTPRAFLRAIIQYGRTDRNPDQNPGLERERTTDVSSQLLFSYKVNPLTVLFVGYSDRRAGFDAVDQPTVPLAQTDRSLFVKLGYAWRP